MIPQPAHDDAHVHRWAPTALDIGGGHTAAPCLSPACPAAVVFAIDAVAFPLSVCGVPLDLHDVDGPGAVVKITCYEATHEYQLDTIPIAPGALVLDIGAHVGTVSCYYAKTRPDVRIVAVEPSDVLWELLQQNLHANTTFGPPDGSHHAYHGAVTGDGRGVTVYGDSAANSGGGSIYSDGAAIYRGESSTLGALLDTHGPCAALLKIDCEGAEHEVLTDDVLTRVDFLVGEFHHAPARGHDAYALLARVRQTLGADKVRVTVVNV